MKALEALKSSVIPTEPYFPSDNRAIKLSIASVAHDDAIELLSLRRARVAGSIWRNTTVTKVAIRNARAPINKQPDDASGENTQYFKFNGVK